MFISTFLPVENCRLADVGSGAGFPGLALKIIFPEIHPILIEPNKKKCAFLSETVRALELTNVEIVPLRFNEIRAESGYAKIITSRALGGFSELLRWGRNALAPRGHLILWIGGEDSRKVASTPDWIWQPAIRIPETQRRFILVGRPKPEEDLRPAKNL
jgi:16S rRNA (guanine527-N7)-methyltransferase